MAAFTKVGKKWRATVGSRDTRRSKTFPNKAKATIWAMNEEALRSGDVTYTLQDALDRYERDVSPKSRSHHWNCKRLKHFSDNLPFIGERIDRVTPDQIAQYRDLRLIKLSPLTVRRELTLLSSVFQVARKEWRWITHNPCHDVTRPKATAPRDNVWTDDDIAAFIAQTGFAGEVKSKSDEVAVAFLFALETAMRASEILSLSPKQIRGRVAHLEMTKNGSKREVPLSTEALRLWGLVGGFTLSSGQLDGLFRKYRDAAKLKPLRFHDTRRTATSRLAKIFSPMELAKVTGHKDLRMLLNVYFKADSESLADRLD